MPSPRRALIIVDVQNDFCPGGALATDRGAEIAGLIGQYQDEHGQDYAHVVATQDWHIDPGAHFSSTPDYLDTWPVHCVADSHGAALHPELRLPGIEAVFRKGAHTAAYSGFEGHAEGVSLAQWLRQRDVDKIDVVGIATDHCVRATVLDGLTEDFEVRVLTDLCAAVDSDRAEETLFELVSSGAQLS